MALPAAPVAAPGLTVIEGGRAVRQAIEEAHVEAIAFTHEVEWAAAEIVNAVTGLPVPSMKAINEALRIAHKANAAKAELLALSPDGAA